MIDYIDLLINDLAEQFKGKARIEGLMKVIGKQLNDIKSFYTDLMDKRSVDSAVGKQLDGIGDIVALSRKEVSLSAQVGSLSVVDDDIYRKYLIYKILKNTCRCNYYDIMKAAYMFWEGPPLKYAESLDEPAFFRLSYDASPELTESSFGVPFIKAGGVGFQLDMNIKEQSRVYFGMAMRLSNTVIVECNVPENVSITFLADENNYILAEDNGAWIAE